MKQKQLPAKENTSTTQNLPLEIVNLLDVLARIELRRKQRASRKEVA